MQARPALLPALRGRLQPSARTYPVRTMQEGLLMPVTITQLGPRRLAECPTCGAGTITTHTRARKWADKHEAKDCT